MSDASVESSKQGSVYGLMAEFDTPQELLTAAEKTHDAGYKQIDAFSPFPVEGLADAIGFHKNRVSLVVLICGMIGGLSGYLLPVLRVRDRLIRSTWAGVLIIHGPHS